MYYRLYLYFYMLVLTFFIVPDLQILFIGLNWHFCIFTSSSLSMLYRIFSINVSKCGDYFQTAVRIVHFTSWTGYTAIWPSHDLLDGLVIKAKNKNLFWNYMFTLVIFWISYFTAGISGVVQTALYADFFYYYFIR